MGNLFIGIDNGKHGACAIIDENRTVLDCFKYHEADTMFFYNNLKKYCTEENALYAFIEKPIVVYGLAHQTAPFETIGRHKMMLEILNIPYKIGDPASGSAVNWKRIIGLFETAKSAATRNTKEISAINKEVKSIKVSAELLGYDERALKTDKLAYMKENLLPLATRYRELKKQLAKLKKDKKSDVKQASVEECLRLFPAAEPYIRKSARAVKNKYDDDIAEAFLLAECGRVLYEQQRF